MPDIEFLHDHLILDACCIINLFASLAIEPILSAMPLSIAVSKNVADKEALFFYRGPADDITAEKEIINLRSYVDNNVLRIVSLDEDTEAETMVRFAGQLEDGEAATGAIAVNRNWAIGTDDKKATRIFRAHSPQIQIVSTPEIIFHWASSHNPSPREVAEALRNIQYKAFYQPDRDHNFYSWWIDSQNQL